jgi:hypothetical protein
VTKAIPTLTAVTVRNSPPPTHPGGLNTAQKAPMTINATTNASIAQ